MGSLLDGSMSFSFSSSSHPDPLLVGAQALKVPTGTLISSVKRLLGRRLADLDAHWVESLPYEVLEDEQGELQLVIEPYNCCLADTTTSSEEEEEQGDKKKLLITPVQVLAILLNGMREAAQVYLKKYAQKKQIVVPGGPSSSPPGTARPSQEAATATYSSPFFETADCVGRNGRAIGRPKWNDPYVSGIHGSRHGLWIGIARNLR